MLVHFPIALLTIYALMEVLSYLFFRASTTALRVKGFLVIVGAASSVPTIVSGLMIKGQFMGDERLAQTVQTHQYFAFSTLILFSFLALIYAVLFLQESPWQHRLATKRWWVILQAKAVCYQKTVLLPSLALIGLCLVTMTGALGGGLVYGPEIDPMVSFIYRLLRL